MLQAKQAEFFGSGEEGSPNKTLFGTMEQGAEDSSIVVKQEQRSNPITTFEQPPLTKKTNIFASPDEDGASDDDDDIIEALLSDDDGGAALEEFRKQTDFSEFAIPQNEFAVGAETNSQNSAESPPRKKSRHEEPPFLLQSPITPRQRERQTSVMEFVKIHKVEKKNHNISHIPDLHHPRPERNIIAPK